MELALIPLFIVLIASVFQGTFGLGMKFMEPLKWEAWWFIHSVIAMILLPVLVALFVVPDLVDVIRNSPSQAMWTGAFYGFLWGIGGILFGKSVPYIGMSLTYGIVMGICSAVGCLIPLFQMDGATSLPSFPYIITGVVVTIVGVAVTAYAGIVRDKSEGTSSTNNLYLGLLIAALSGILSSFLNVGFVSADAVGEVAQEYGVIARNSSLAIWVVVLTGGFAMNAGYSLFLLAKNNTWSSFSAEKSGKSYFWAVMTSILWFGALAIYGQGVTLMGDLGAIVGWPILLGVSLIVSNIWAYRNKEWSSGTKSFKLLLFGLALLIFATIVLAYANTI